MRGKDDVCGVMLVRYDRMGAICGSTQSFWGETDHRNASGHVCSCSAITDGPIKIDLRPFVPSPLVLSKSKQEGFHPPRFGFWKLWSKIGVGVCAWERERETALSLCSP